MPVDVVTARRFAGICLHEAAALRTAIRTAGSHSPEIIAKSEERSRGTRALLDRISDRSTLPVDSPPMQALIDRAGAALLHLVQRTPVHLEVDGWSQMTPSGAPLLASVLPNHWAVTAVLCDLGFAMDPTLLKLDHKQIRRAPTTVAARRG
jgi:hypothetical protein